ncbi:uncharacterized protein N7500_005401, partial [Penicillium coprophilum]|uniref:uncharacterized protein n=1 Tax=Penicillium coprophilum TaxID=36646 RepID=UPI0023A0AA00
SSGGGQQSNPRKFDQARGSLPYPKTESYQRGDQQPTSIACPSTSNPQRKAGPEDAVENLVRKKSKAKNISYAHRESVLNSWIQDPSSAIGGINNTAYEEDTQADIQAIVAKEEIDPETAERWKVVFLDRYGLRWRVDCGKGNELKFVHVEVIRLAQVLHGWGETHEDT